MIKALRISIGDVTYENVKIAAIDEIYRLGLIPVVGKHTIMFRYDNKWHACHSLELKIIHLSRSKFSIPGAIPYERLVIASDKIYGPGKYATNEVLQNAGVDDLWLGIERQVAFYSIEGTFVATDYSITNVIFPLNHPPINHMGGGILRMSESEPNLHGHMKRSGVRPCRSKR